MKLGPVEQGENNRLVVCVKENMGTCSDLNGCMLIVLCAMPLGEFDSKLGENQQAQWHDFG